MNDELKDLIETTHVMAEMLKLHYDAFVQAGFNRRQAMRLTSALMKCMWGDGEDDSQS